MNWRLKFGGEEVVFRIVEQVAIKPASDVLESAAAPGAALDFKKNAAAELFGELTMQPLPSDNRIFARAGWWFITPKPEVTFAAEIRTAVSGAEEIQQVFVTENKRLLIGTNLATVRLHQDLTDAEIAEVLEEDQLEIVYSLLPNRYTFEVRLPSQRAMPEIINLLQDKTERYVYAEPSFLQVITGRLKPKDVYYPKQWQHNNDGSEGVAGADIHSERAWDITRGTGAHRPVRVAIVDNGMQISHPDFAGGIRGGGFFEPTGSGTALFVPLQDATTNFPDKDHGTFCMGMAGARMDNDGKGVCGSAPESHLMPFACFDDQTGTQTTLARAIKYAADPRSVDSNASADDGADIISCSLDTGGLMQSGLGDAIHEASKSGRKGLGIPIFWAVSNDFVPISADKLCSNPDVISIGRCNRGGVSDKSAFGPELDFLAPGTAVFSTRSENQFTESTGTSFATPLAAGVAALVIAVNPNLKGAEVRQILRASCTKHGTQERSDEYGFGLLNAEDAVKLAMKSLPNGPSFP